jgi:hypothetical protein
MQSSELRAPLAADFKLPADARTKVVVATAFIVHIEPNARKVVRFETCDVRGLCLGRCGKQALMIIARILPVDFHRRSSFQIEKKRRRANVQAASTATITGKRCRIGHRVLSTTCPPHFTAGGKGIDGRVITKPIEPVVPSSGALRCSGARRARKKCEKRLCQTGFCGPVRPLPICISLPLARPESHTSDRRRSQFPKSIHHPLRCLDRPRCRAFSAWKLGWPCQY